jgi:hypothetical protein
MRIAAQTQVQLLLTPTFDFVLEQPFQKLDVRPFTVDRLAMAGIQCFQDTGQSELFEMGRELMFQFHRAAPRSGPKSSKGDRTKVVAGGEIGMTGGASCSSPFCRIRLTVL